MNKLNMVNLAMRMKNGELVLAVICCENHIRNVAKKMPKKYKKLTDQQVKDVIRLAESNLDFEEDGFSFGFIAQTIKKIVDEGISKVYDPQSMEWDHSEREFYEKTVPIEVKKHIGLCIRGPFAKEI